MEPTTHLEAHEALSALEDIVQQRRATPHFSGEPVPSEVIDTALSIASQAPSGYNLQPWRFLVLTDADQRRKLQTAAFNQEKIGEAPVVIIAFGVEHEWRERADEVFRTRAARTGMSDAAKLEQAKQGAFNFIAKFPPGIWLNRHVMIAFTYLMLAFEFQGWDTAPMEGYDPDAVKLAFELPPDTTVVALLAVGRGRDVDPPHPGRLSVSDIAYHDHYGEPYRANPNEA